MPVYERELIPDLIAITMVIQMNPDSGKSRTFQIIALTPPGNG